MNHTTTISTATPAHTVSIPARRARAMAGTVAAKAKVSKTPLLDALAKTKPMRAVKVNTPPTERETDFYPWLVGLAHACGFLASHTYAHAAVMTGPDAGVPDWQFCGHGRYIVAEIKRDRKKKLRAGQELWGAWLQAAGVEYYVWTPADRPEIERIFTQAMMGSGRRTQATKTAGA